MTSRWFAAVDATGAATAGCPAADNTLRLPLAATPITIETSATFSTITSLLNQYMGGLPATAQLLQQHCGTRALGDLHSERVSLSKRQRRLAFLGLSIQRGAPLHQEFHDTVQPGHRRCVESRFSAVIHGSDVITELDRQLDSF